MTGLVHLELSRSDVRLLIECLDQAIEAFAFDGGTVLAKDEIRLRELLSDALIEHDRLWRNQLTLESSS